jgi:hypothetical protein
MHNVSKADKKILLKAIDIGMQKAFISAITEADKVITTWKEKKPGSSDACHALFKTLNYYALKCIGSFVPE